MLRSLGPDAIVLDNVVMFPAVAQAGCPWIRVISCAETELPDADVPPYLSGLAADDRAGRIDFLNRYTRAVAPAHARYNAFRRNHGLGSLDKGLFLEPSPHLNLMLTPKIVKRPRAQPLDPARFTYLEGCVRREGPFDLPDFPQNTGPLIYVSFGSLGAMDLALIERMLAVFAKIPGRFIVNVGGFQDAYRAVPDNVHLGEWFPQPSVVAMADLFIHHGGNNSYCEALWHGVPSLIMPYCWDGHDNAIRAEETGTGRALARASWTEESLTGAINELLNDSDMKERLAVNATDMARRPGVDEAADRILALAVPSAKREKETTL
jgi:MGT family glycosyltransferase